MKGEYVESDVFGRMEQLRKNHKYSKQYVADYLKINKTTYGRIESGDTKTVNNEILAGLAKLYNVSTDFLLGLSNIPEKIYYDIEQLGLSIEAAEILCSHKVDTRVVNELLINKKFATVTALLANYYTAVANNTAAVRNDVIDFQHSLLENMSENESLPNVAEIKNLAKKVKNQKEPSRQLELEKIKATFMTSVREIKEKVISEVNAADVRQIVDGDIISAVQDKAQVQMIQNAKTDEEKAAIFANAIVAGMSMDSNISEKKLQDMIPGIEIIAKAVMTDDKSDEE